MFHVAILRGKPGNLWSAIKASIKDIQIKMTRTNRIYETFFFLQISREFVSLGGSRLDIPQGSTSIGYIGKFCVVGNGIS